MNREPFEKSSSERRQELENEQELLRLKQQEGRLDTVRRVGTFVWIVNGIYFLVGALEILLFLRFLLRFTGANPQSEFTQFIYNLSAPFMAPFSTLFASPASSNGANIFDFNILIAIVIYSLAGWLCVRLVRFIYARP